VSCTPWFNLLQSVIESQLPTATTATLDKRATITKGYTTSYILLSTDEKQVLNGSIDANWTSHARNFAGCASSSLSGMNIVQMSASPNVSISNFEETTLNDFDTHNRLAMQLIDV